MTIEIGDILRIACKFVGQGSNNAMNVWTVRVTKGGGTPEADFIASVQNDLTYRYNLYLATAVSGNVGGSVATWTRRNPISGLWTEIGETPFNFVAVGGAEAAAQFTAGVVSYGVEGGGRKGRKHIYGLSEATTGNGLLSLTGYIALLSFGVTTAIPFGDLNAEVEPGVLRDGEVFKPFTGTVTVKQKQGSMLRRMIGRGW